MSVRMEHNNLYKEFNNYSYEQLQTLFKESKTKEEQDFYMTLANLLLKHKQKKVVESDII